MSSEQIKFSEFSKEQIPTPEEINSVFTELIHKEFTETRKCQDEKGLYLLEVTIPGESEGEIIEYAYMRKGRYPEGQSSENEIHVTYYKNGFPVSGTSAARLINGKWEIL